MKLINIEEGNTYKAKSENIYYKRIGEYVFKSYFYSKDIEDYKFIVNSIDELETPVFDMELIFSINYKVDDDELNISIGQADNQIFLNNQEIRQLLNEITEVINNPF